MLLHITSSILSQSIIANIVGLALANQIDEEACAYSGKFSNGASFRMKLRHTSFIVRLEF